MATKCIVIGENPKKEKLKPIKFEKILHSDYKVSENKDLIKLGKEASKYNNLIVYPPKIMIPTAEEFLRNKQFMRSEFECEANYELMIEFARLHSKATAEACYEEASNSDLNTSQLDRIANAYPLDNIK